MKNYSFFAFFLIIFISISSIGYSQVFLLDQDTDQTIITTCSGTLYDSGGPTGDYSSDEDFVVTILPDVENANIRLLFSEFSLESSAFDGLSIYDGLTIEAEPIHTNVGDITLMGKTIEATNGALTIVFQSDNSVVNTGFAADISCFYPCQDYSIEIVSTFPEITNEDSAWVDICQGEQISFFANGTFPQNELNYLQNNENLNWLWIFKKGDVSNFIEGVGLPNINYTFTEPGGYFVKLLATDPNGCLAYANEIRVRTSLPPDFSNMISPSDICIGEEIELNGSFTQDTFSLEASFSNFEAVCFEDIIDIWQTTCFSIFSNLKSSYISSGDDIESICINFEHSYLGDLDIELECPNGQVIRLFDQACGSTYFGEPDQNDNCVPGIGQDYCWKMDAASLMSDNCSSGNTLAGGDYLPYESFDGLVGCPIEGDWCLNIMDNIGIDDGTVFDFDINLSSDVFSGGYLMWQYSNTYDTSAESTDIYWSGENVDATSIGNAIVIPEEPGEFEYTFNVIDNWGCSYDTSFNITVYSADDTICGFFCAIETITDLEGVINDGSSDEYFSQNDANCSWLIAPGTKSDGLIVFQWNYFEVYENDTVKIYNGVDENSPLIGAYTEGSELPSSMLTFGHQAYITYTTDSVNRSPGWELTYQSTLVDIDDTDAIEPYLFPNPANNKLSIHGISNICELSIFDHVGAEYLSISKFEGGDIDISNLAPGVYIVKLNCDSGSKTLKFVKE